MKEVKTKFECRQVSRFYALNYSLQTSKIPPVVEEVCEARKVEMGARPCGTMVHHRTSKR